MANAYATAPYEDMGPTLLAQQPPTPPDKLRNPSENWSIIFTYLEARFGMLRSWRWAWWAHWAVLARFFMPRRYIWLVVANKMWRGSPINDAIIDSTAQQAVRTCRSGMWTGLTSPSRPWMKLGVRGSEADADAKNWLKDSTERVFTVLHESNFYDIMSQAFEDVTVFGNAPIITYEDAEDVVRFYLPCHGEFYLQCGSRNSTETFAREYTQTVQQIVEMFRIENCPEPIRTLWANGGAALDREFVVRHIIEPNFDLPGREKTTGSKIKVLPSAFTWREIYWLMGIKAERPLSKRGFQSIQPFAVLQWYKAHNDAYARSPCMDALGDNKQVQSETYRKAEYIDKGVRPPMRADPSLKNEPASIMPSMITYTSTKEGFTPLFEVNPAWVTALTADIDMVNKRIQSCLFVDLFFAISRMEGVQPRNELELTKRDLERLQELGPVIDLAEKALSLIILRVLDIMQRRKLLKPMPKSLQGMPLKINYISIMRLAQRSAESIAMKDVFQTAGELSSAAHAAGVPDPIRKINLDKALETYGDLNNSPQDCWFSDDEVKQHDAIRQQEMQKAQAPGQAMAAVDAAKTLSDTQLPGGQNALGAMMGQQGNQT